MGEIPQISARKKDLGAERGKVEWSVSEGFAVRGRENSPIITVFLSPLIRRSESSVLLGLVGQGCNQGEVRHGVFAHWAPCGFPQRQASTFTLRGAGAHIAPNYPIILKGHECGLVQSKGDISYWRSACACNFSASDRDSPYYTLTPCKIWVIWPY